MLRAEYVAAQVALRDLTRHQSELGKRLGVRPGDSVVQAYYEHDVRTRAGERAIGFQADILSHVMFLMTPAVEPVMRATARATASFHAIECLLALRRWQLTGDRGAPTGMATMTSLAGLQALPTDPYDGKPVRLAVRGGQPIVYAVGTDGKDDGGQNDSDRDQRPTGDLPYRLPPPAADRWGRNQTSRERNQRSSVVMGQTGATPAAS